MDINEFHLMFKKDSPLFKSEEFGEIVRKTLLSEKVPHSKKSTSGPQHLTNMTYGKQQTATSRQEKVISVNNVLDSWLNMNDLSYQDCVNKHSYSGKCEKIVSMDATLSSGSSPGSSPCISNISNSSHQVSAHAPHAVSTHAPEFHSLRAPQLNQSCVQCTNTDETVSFTSVLSENLMSTDNTDGVFKKSHGNILGNTYGRHKKDPYGVIAGNSDLQSSVNVRNQCSSNTLQDSMQPFVKSTSTNALQDNLRTFVESPSIVTSHDTMLPPVKSISLNSTLSYVKSTSSQALQDSKKSFVETASKIDALQDNRRLFVKSSSSNALQDVIQSPRRLSSTSALQNNHVNNTRRFLSSGVLNDISCSCDDFTHKSNKDCVTPNPPPVVSKSEYRRMSGEFATTSRGLHSQTTSAYCGRLAVKDSSQTQDFTRTGQRQGLMSSGINLKHPGEDHRNAESLKRFKVTGSANDGTGAENSSKGNPDCIAPAEVGKMDTKEMEAMIASLVKANQYFTEFPRHNEPEKDTLIQEQNKYLENKKTTQSLNEADEKEKIRIRVLEHSVKYIEMRITESVRFAKLIPGFLQLPLEDQANLIRESRTESGIVGGMRGINADKQVFSSRQGAFFSLEDMKLVFDENLLKEKICLSKKINELHMSLEEEAILRAMTITAADRCLLQRKDIAEDIQNKLLSCLLHVVSKKGHEPVARRLGKLFDVLMCCRNVTEVDMKQVKKILLEWPSFSSYKLAGEFL